MAGSGMVCKVTCVVLMCLMVIAPYVVNADVSCSTVYNDLLPCLDYIRNGLSTVPTNCCSGIKTLYSAAATPTDRQNICKCLKQVAEMATGNQLNLAASLPSKCGVKLPYKISTKTDCAKVK